MPTAEMSLFMEKDKKGQFPGNIGLLIETPGLSNVYPDMKTCKCSLN